MFLHTLKHYDQMKGKAYNVGLSDANLSKQEFCGVIQEKVPEFRFVVSDIGEDPDKRNCIVNNHRIEATGFQTSISIRVGIAELIKGFQVIRRNQFSNL